MSSVRRVSVAWVIGCLLLLGGHKIGVAQADDELWSQPMNLSRSGAAESPVLVVGSDQQSQVFWWDRFDGLTTSYAFDNDWSTATPAPIQMIEMVGEGVSARVVTSTIAAIPHIVGVDETAFALWIGTPNRDTGLRPLLISRLRLGTTAWTAPGVLVESAHRVGNDERCSSIKGCSIWGSAAKVFPRPI